MKDRLGPHVQRKKLIQRLKVQRREEEQKTQDPPSHFEDGAPARAKD